MEISIGPSAATEAERWNGNSKITVASRLGSALLIPIAALGFIAATATSQSGSKVAPPASFLGPSPTTPRPPKPLHFADATATHAENQTVISTTHPHPG